MQLILALNLLITAELCWSRHFPEALQRASETSIPKPAQYVSYAQWLHKLCNQPKGPLGQIPVWLQDRLQTENFEGALDLDYTGQARRLEIVAQFLPLLLEA